MDTVSSEPNGKKRGLEHREPQRESQEDRHALMEQLRRAKGRNQKIRVLDAADRYLLENPHDREVEQARTKLDERFEWWFNLRVYLPAFLFLWLAIGLASGGQWGLSAVGAVATAWIPSTVVAVVINTIMGDPRNTED